MKDRYPNESLVSNYISENHEFFCMQGGNIESALDSNPANWKQDKGTRIHDLEDVLHHLLNLSLVGAVRYTRKTLVQCDEQRSYRCGPIMPPYKLAMIYRLHPMPFPIRSYDVMPLTLRSCAIHLGIIDTRSPTSRPSTTLRADLLFMAILNRFTGRPKVYSLYKEHATVNDTCKCIIPDPSEVDGFINFIEVHDLHPYLFNQQHGDAIPRDIKVFPNVFRKFISSVGQKIDDLLSNLISC